MGCPVSSWLNTNQAFHLAAQVQAAALAKEFGLADAYRQARLRREELPDGEAKVFAYNVELQAAEAAGISLDRPRARALGKEPPVWFLPFITQRLLTRIEPALARFLAHLSVRAAPDVLGLLGAYAGGDKCKEAASLLTPRQTECLQWAAEGKSSTDIAVILAISAHTVDEHLDNACRRLGVRRRSQAIAKAITLGIIAIPPN